MKISYAITVCNEIEEIKTLLPTLINSKKPEDEIVVLFDKQKGTAEVWNYLQEQPVTSVSKSFKNHFADWKNHLTSLCSGDYIFQIDADEVPNPILINNIHSILETNPEVDVYHVPRVNTVEGLTDEHIKKWRWRVNDQGWVNWPDYQMRVYKNNSTIKWKNKVHEVLEGHTKFSAFPPQEELALYHPKNIKRQEQQNEFYEKI
tara:strand:+ start:3103 stop:3714 length:612 start_codon:yes stop_codon:yes gene_type:complete